ncbi:hypothetical protein D3C78_1593890 [compost metagenome]
MNSSTTRNRPRLNRNAETSPRPWCFSPYSQADRPVSRTNTGAQRWARVRLKNSDGSVASMVIGSLTWRCRKNVSRTWSKSMNRITRPRRASMLCRRWVIREGVALALVMEGR